MDIRRKLLTWGLPGLLLAVSLAHAQGAGPGPGAGPRGHGGGMMGRGGPPVGGPPMMSMQGALPEPERRLQWVNERDDTLSAQRPRMSREERQELRRDIHDAGRDLYPRRRHARQP